MLFKNDYYIYMIRRDVKNVKLANSVSKKVQNEVEALLK